MKFINRNKKFIFGMVLGLIVSGGVVYASGLLASSITYDNTTSQLKDSQNNNVTDVQTAIDVLYNKAQAASQSGSGSSSSSFSSLSSSLSRTPVTFYNDYASNDYHITDGSERCDNPSTCDAGIFMVQFSDEYYTYDNVYGGICLYVGNEQYCFRTGNFAGEVEYFKSILPDADCSLNSDSYNCYSSLKDIACDFKFQGGLYCVHYSNYLDAEIASDANGYCSHP